MIDFLEIKYLSITWENEEKVSQLRESIDPIEIQQKEDDSYFIETTAFPKVYHYVGIHIIGNPSDYDPPYFELYEGEKEKLAAVTSPSDEKIWWIQKTRWNKKNKCFDSEIFRSVGTVTLVVKSKKLTIINNYMDFTVDELNYYLQDFKNNLWELILDNSNPVKGSIEGSAPNFFKEETLQLYSEFLKVVRKVVDNPNMFLSERQSKLPIKKARPVASTFRELATNPQRKEVSSRDFFESYNTAENKYINFCVRKVAYLLRSFERLSNQRASEFKNNIDHQIKIKQELQNTREVTISNKVLQNEVNTIQEQIDELESLKVSRKVHGFDLYTSQAMYKYEFELFLGKPYGKTKGSYFIQAVNRIDIKDYLSSVNLNNCTYAVISFDAKDDFDVGKIDLAYMTVQVAGYGVDQVKRNSKNKDYTDVSLQVITYLNFDIKQHRLYQTLESRKEQLNKMNGRDLKRPLSSVERREIQEECRVIDKKVELLKKTKTEVGQFISHLPGIKSQIKYIIDFFEKNRVGISHVFPNSMVFIQNPNYAGAKSLFKKIIDLNGLDLGLLEDMMSVDEIGLTNISNLYERWCLIKVIKVLNEIYGFSLNEGWQQSLINSVLTNKYNATINMYSNQTRQLITVSYEKEIILSKKNQQGILQTRHIRPDIVVDVSSPELSVEYNSNKRVSRLKVIGKKSSRLVLDAKFKDLNEHSHQELVKNLYFGKNYSENGKNKVFIIHPTPHVIENPTSPLIWGTFCDYGQTGKYPDFGNIKSSQTVNEDNINTNKHRLGGIFLAPSLRYSSSKDNLQRLIGMFLQENSQRYHCSRTDVKWHTMTCISCGNTNRTKLTLSYDKTKGDNDKWELRCDKCKQRTVQTVCVKCGYEIFKNGMKWTYHRTRAEQFTNVVCPNCESFL